MDTDAQLETAHDGSLAGVEQENPTDRQTKILETIVIENEEIGR